MAIVEISVGRLKYRLECQDGDKEKLIHIAKKLDQNISKVIKKISNIDEKTLLVITALKLQEDLEKQDLKDNLLEEHEIHDKLADNVDNVADYIEKLAKKIENY